MKKSQKVYSYKTCEEYINNKLVPLGYEIEQINGCLVDNYICYAPDEKHYNFVMLEAPLSDQSSGLTVQRYARIPDAVKQRIELLRRANNGEPFKDEDNELKIDVVKRDGYYEINWEV